MEPNRFLSLSNLDGDSTASDDEIALTTVLVLHPNASGSVQNKAGSTEPGQGHIQSATGLHSADLNPVQGKAGAILAQRTAGHHSKVPSPVQSTANELLSHPHGAKLLVRQPGIIPKQKQISSRIFIKEKTTPKPVSK